MNTARAITSGLDVLEAPPPNPRAESEKAFDGADDETPADLRARGVRQLEEQRAIAETLAQSWPRLDGETPDPAVHWQAAGFCDAEVVAWLEVGVPWVGMALELREAGVEPRAVGREWESGCTLGLAFARGDVSLARALAEVER